MLQTARQSILQGLQYEQLEGEKETKMCHHIHYLYAHGASLTLQPEHNTCSGSFTGQVVRESHQGDAEGDTRLEAGYCELPLSRVYRFIRWCNSITGIVEYEPSGVDSISRQYPGECDSSYVHYNGTDHWRSSPCRRDRARYN